MTFSERLLTTAAMAGCLHVGHGVAVAQSGCTVGLSTVACPATSRTITVAQSGTAHYRYIQYALDAAAPGDTILVRAGVYTEPVYLRVSGTPTAPVTLKAYPGERPVIQPYADGRTANVALTGRWLVLDGFEIRGGRHGVVVSGGNNLVQNNYIHDNGQGCPGELCGQGVIVSSASDVAIVNNRIERNGLNGVSPWLLHGIYVSDYFGPATSRVSVIGNTVREHAGAGLQAWTASTVTTDVLLQGNTFENNVMEVILSSVQNSVLRSNTFVHTGTHPATNAPRSIMLWLDSSRNVAFEGNTFRYRAVSAFGVPTVPLQWYAASQTASELRWRRNIWDAPGTGLSDSMLNVPVAAAAPGRPTIVASQSASNPVSLTWVAGTGSDPTDYTLLVGTTPGGTEAGTIPMSNLAALTAAAPVGTQLFVRVMGRNSFGSTTSNEVRLRVASQAPPPPPAPTMRPATVNWSTVSFAWQSSVAVTGYTVIARYVAGGPVIATVPAAGTATSMVLPAVPVGSYAVSIVAHLNGTTSAESNSVVVTVR